MSKPTKIKLSASLSKKIKLFKEDIAREKLAAEKSLEKIGFARNDFKNFDVIYIDRNAAKTMHEFKKMIGKNMHSKSRKIKEWIENSESHLTIKEMTMSYKKYVIDSYVDSHVKDERWNNLPEEVRKETLKFVESIAEQSISDEKLMKAFEYEIIDMI